MSLVSVVCSNEQSSATFFVIAQLPYLINTHFDTNLGSFQDLLPLPILSKNMMFFFRHNLRMPCRTIFSFSVRRVSVPFDLEREVFRWRGRECATSRVCWPKQQTTIFVSIVCITFFRGKYFGLNCIPFSSGQLSIKRLSRSNRLVNWIVREPTLAWLEWQVTHYLRPDALTKHSGFTFALPRSVLIPQGDKKNLFPSRMFAQWTNNHQLKSVVAWTLLQLRETVHAFQFSLWRGE